MEKEEDEVLKARTSRKTYIPIYFMVLILLSTAGYIKYSGKEINSLAFGLMIFFSIVAIFMTEINRLGNLYEINDRSLVHIKGIFFKTTKKTDLLAVSDAELKQNPWQQLLNFGNVEAVVFSRDSTTYVKNINNPSRFLDFLGEKMNQKRNPQGKRRRNE